MKKVIKVKNLEVLQKYGLEYIPPYPEEKLNEEYKSIIDKLFETDIAMKLVCMQHIHAEKGCDECPLYGYDILHPVGMCCIHSLLKTLTKCKKKIDEEIERREEAWADEHGLTGDE